MKRKSKKHCKWKQIVAIFVTFSICVVSFSSILADTVSNESAADSILVNEELEPGGGDSEEDVVEEKPEQKVEEGKTDKGTDSKVLEPNPVLKSKSLVVKSPLAAVTDEATLKSAIVAISTSGTVTIDNNITLTSVVNIPNGKSINLKSGTGGPFTIDHSFAETTHHFSVEGELTLENIKIDGNGNNGGIRISSGKFVMNKGAVISRCVGGGVALEKKSNMIMNDGEISYNVRPNIAVSGGGINLQDSTAVMNGGVIHNNQASWGGGVEVGAKSNFIMKNGSIINNKAISEYGGGVSVYVLATFTMDGGIIANNTAYDGAGVFVGQSTHMSHEPTDWCRFIMNGGSIENNTAVQTAGGIGALYNGQIEMNGGKITGNKASAGAGVSIQRSEYEDKGVYFTMNNGEISNNKATGSFGGGIFIYDIGGKLTQLTIGKKGDKSSNPKIFGNTAVSQGGGIMLYSINKNAKADIYSGEIYNNTAGSLGGGICSYASSTVNMYGGSIYKNTTTSSSGGGIATFDGTNVFNMSGGVVTENKAFGTGGGGIYLASGTVANITGGAVTKNEAVKSGGGIFTNTHDTVIKDSSITSNTAVNGGGVYITNGASADISSATKITNNKASEYGGGIFTENYDYNSPADTIKYSNLTVSSSVVFGNNTANEAYAPPSNAANFANIAYAETSLKDSGGYVHPINNYDINYELSPPLSLVKVIYDANGGVGGYIDNSIVTGSDYSILTLKDTGITRKGYKFTGWNTSADGKGTAYVAGDVIVVDDTVTLYAQWEKEEEPTKPPKKPKPEKKPKDKKPKESKTGDTNSIWTGLVLMILASGGVVLLKRRKDTSR